MGISFTDAYATRQDWIYVENTCERSLRLDIGFCCDPNLMGYGIFIGFLIFRLDIIF